jgi:hypothetical protein
MSKNKKRRQANPQPKNRGTPNRVSRAALIRKAPERVNGLLTKMSRCRPAAVNHAFSGATDNIA